MDGTTLAEALIARSLTGIGNRDRTRIERLSTVVAGRRQSRSQVRIDCHSRGLHMASHQVVVFWSTAQRATLLSSFTLGFQWNLKVPPSTTTYTSNPQEEGLKLWFRHGSRLEGSRCLITGLTLSEIRHIQATHCGHRNLPVRVTKKFQSTPTDIMALCQIGSIPGLSIDLLRFSRPRAGLRSRCILWVLTTLARCRARIQ